MIPTLVLTYVDSHVLSGIQVDVPSGKIKERGTLLISSADLPAKAPLVNMKQYNGAYGCNFCEDEGVPRASSHLHRNWPHMEHSTLHTHASMVENAKKALDTGKANNFNTCLLPVQLINPFLLICTV